MPQKEPKMPRGGPVIHTRQTQYPETGEPPHLSAKRYSGDCSGRRAHQELC